MSFPETGDFPYLSWMKPEGIEYSDVLSDVDVILDRRQAENNLDLSKPKCMLNPPSISGGCGFLINQ